jgi:hypothetical protein
MLLSGRGTTRIKRGHRIWPNHTPRSMSIQWDTVLFGRMGSPNIYIGKTCNQLYHSVGLGVALHFIHPERIADQHL